MAKPLTKREHSVLQVAVIHRWHVEYDSSGRATWDGDYLLPFRSHSTLDRLVKIGLMESVTGGLYGRSYRATSAGRDYACTALGCDKGSIFGQNDDGCDVVIGKCSACKGTGLMLVSRTALANIGSAP